jgi:hypothetical protein
VCHPRENASKPARAQCPIHCYHPRQRERVKAVMRHAGPRLAFRHTYLALRHWLDGFRKVPPRPRRPAPREIAARSPRRDAV